MGGVELAARGAGLQWGGEGIGWLVRGWRGWVLWLWLWLLLWLWLVFAGVFVVMDGLDAMEVYDTGVFVPVMGGVGVHCG